MTVVADRSFKTGLKLLARIIGRKVMRDSGRYSGELEMDKRVGFPNEKSVASKESRDVGSGT